MNFNIEQITQAQLDLCVKVVSQRTKNEELAKEMVFTTIEKLLKNKTQIHTSLTAYIIQGALLNWLNYNKTYASEIKARPFYVFLKNHGQEAEEPTCQDQTEPGETMDAKKTLLELKTLIEERLPPKQQKWYTEYLLAGGQLPDCYKSTSPQYNSMKTHIRLAKATLKKELEKYGL